MRISNNFELIAACSWLLILGLLGSWNVISQQSATSPVQLPIAAAEQNADIAPIELEPIVDTFERSVDDFIVVGSSLTEADIESIRAAVQSFKGEDWKTPLDKRILSIQHTAPHQAVVMTGVVRGPLDGGDNTVYLQRQGGVWKVTRTDGGIYCFDQPP